MKNCYFKSLTVAWKCPGGVSEGSDDQSLGDEIMGQHINVDGGNEGNVVGMTSNIPTRVTSSTTRQVVMEIVTKIQGSEEASSTVGHAHVGACSLQTFLGFTQYLSSHPHMVERDDGYFYDADKIKYK